MKKETIKASPLFENLSEQDYANLAAIAHIKSYKRGEMIFAEGDEGTGFYIVGQGKVKIFKLSPEGKEQILHIFSAGEPFGEVPVFSGHCYPAYAEALAKAEMLYFPRAEFISLIKNEPSLALNMLSVLSLRLKRFTGLIENLSLKEVPGRLAAYLLYVSTANNDTDDVVLDISKGQLASILGTIPETLSRILTRMTKEGIIENEGKRLYHITNRDYL
ncbi:MAG: Crp/Fnr family transcriptional regulator, partial [bacterium]|nr:Crp/Fnr family transcriptional regulator [bacterium]